MNVIKLVGRGMKWSSLGLLFSCGIAAQVQAQVQTQTQTPAQPLPVGSFGHRYTDAPNTAVWTVTLHNPATQEYRLLRHSDAQQTKLKPLTKKEREQFWARMHWSLNEADAAVCLGNWSDILCYVPRKVRLKNDWLKSYKTDFFHYDTIGGVMEMLPLK
jgi:hypothetical protein